MIRLNLSSNIEISPLATITPIFGDPNVGKKGGLTFLAMFNNNLVNSQYNQEDKDRPNKHEDNILLSENVIDNFSQTITNLKSSFIPKNNQQHEIKSTTSNKEDNQLLKKGYESKHTDKMINPPVDGLKTHTSSYEEDINTVKSLNILNNKEKLSTEDVVKSTTNSIFSNTAADGKAEITNNIDNLIISEGKTSLSQGTTINSNRIISSDIKSLTESIYNEIKEFQSGNLNSNTITIRVKPSNLGEIIIVLEKSNETLLSKVVDKSTGAPIDIRLIASNPEVTNYLNLIKREIANKSGVRTISIHNNTAKFVDKVEPCQEKNQNKY